MNTANKTPPTPFVAALLGALGILPFAIGSVLALIPETQSAGLLLLLGYGAVILSFLGGIQWGLALRADAGSSLAYVVSNAIALGAWASLLVAPATGLLVLGGGFLAALLFDLVAQSFLRPPAWFLRLRMLLTGAVVLALAVAYVPFV